MFFTKRLAVLALALTAAAPAVAQDNITEAYNGLVDLLRGAGLNRLINVTAQLATVPAGQAVIAGLLSGEPMTFFAPNDNSCVPENVTSNIDALSQVMAYHVIVGANQTIERLPNTTVVRTLLGRSTYLEGDQNQVLSYASEADNRVFIRNQNTRVNVENTLQYRNITIQVVNAVIDLPGPLTYALAMYNLTTLSAVLSRAGVLEQLDTLHGLTLLAPTDAAFAALLASVNASGINLATIEPSVLNSLLANHVIKGTTVYAKDLITNKPASAAGPTYGGNFTSADNFVTLGSSSARIVTPDIVLWSGSMHIIDTVLTNGLNLSSGATATPSASGSGSGSGTGTGSSATGTPSPRASGSSGNISAGSRLAPTTMAAWTAALSSVLLARFLMA